MEHFIIGLIAMFLLCDPADNVEVILLPQDDGSVGEVAVYQDSKETVLNKAWQKVQTKNLDEKEILSKEEVESEYKNLLDAMPDAVKKYKLYFEFGSENIVGESVKVFKEIAQTIKDDKILKIDIIGYTDRAGSDTFNKTLSMSRANKVADLLKSEGVDEKIISIDYYGEANPIVETADGVANEANRRVEITLK